MNQFISDITLINQQHIALSFCFFLSFIRTMSNSEATPNEPTVETSSTGENLSPVKSKTENVQVVGIHLLDDVLGCTRMLAMLDQFSLSACVASYAPGEQCCGFRLTEQYAHQFHPEANTLEFGKTLPHALRFQMKNVEFEILCAMLGAPQPLVFANFEEFISSVRVRARIVDSAKRTQLAFGTSKAERPEDFWTYKEGTGYTIIPGQSLITALKKATQPDSPESTRYSFSCYRATEYVILHAIAQELAIVNPDLLRQLQQMWEMRPIKSGEYHDVFLDEYGSLENPLPTQFYIPGDRVWFRNPDPQSSNVSGYEGSWVIYLGNGLFSNFWKLDQPYTFADKCIEIYHWRDATFTDDEGELRIDETIVEDCIQKTKSNPALALGILKKMTRPRDPRNVFADGGCADVSREAPKAMCLGTAKIKLPDNNETIN